MDLISLIDEWLKDEMPLWRAAKSYKTLDYGIWKDSVGSIIYKGLGYTYAIVYETRLMFFEDDLIIQAYDAKFFPLLSSRLHMAQIGFRKAEESRKSWPQH
jgi:hypothetical protein